MNHRIQIVCDRKGMKYDRTNCVVTLKNGTEIAFLDPKQGSSRFESAAINLTVIDLPISEELYTVASIMSRNLIDLSGTHLSVQRPV